MGWVVVHSWDTRWYFVKSRIGHEWVSGVEWSGVEWSRTGRDGTGRAGDREGMIDESEARLRM